MSEAVGPVLRTPRLVLEPISAGDSEELFETVVGQEGVMRWLATRQAGTRADAETMCHNVIAHWSDYGYGQFSVREAAAREFQGRVGLRHRPEHGTDLGSALSPHCHGRGIAREAGTAYLDWAFDRLGLRVTFGFVLSGSAAWIALLRRLGGTEAGTVVSSGHHCLRFRFSRRGFSRRE
ncbi:GNAT family N-acetyltransferase [Sciscionella marina]|uniref:GNAT family N-acetyltransferase n=1 Tax=Sciscionella marina TaxID=508770 RepID=UPI0003726F8D|nr:GNAT family N-acetyltransferase [Sciscionella marina]